MMHYKKSFAVFSFIGMIFCYAIVLICNAQEYGFTFQPRLFSTLLDAAKLSPSVIFARSILGSMCCLLSMYLICQRKGRNGKRGLTIWACLCPIIIVVLAGCIGQRLFLDDLIAAVSGSIVGIFLAQLEKANGLCKNSKIRTCIMKACCLLYVAALTGILAADVATPYGAIRYNYELLPKGAEATELMEQSTEPTNIYTHESPGMWALAHKLCKQFDIKMHKMRITPSWFHGLQNIEIWSIFTKPWLIVDSDGCWRYHAEFNCDMEYATQIDRQRGKAVGLLAPFLHEDEQITFESVNWDLLGFQDFDYPVLVYTVSSQRSDVYYLDNEIRIAVCNDRILMLGYGVIRGIETGSVKQISAKEAYSYATRFCADWRPYGAESAWSILSVEETYVPCRKRLLPAYSFQLGRFENGEIVERTETIVDAVDRGILPYIIHGGVLFILLAALVLAVGRKSTGRKVQALTIEDSLDGKAEVQKQMDEQTDMK